MKAAIFRRGIVNVNALPLVAGVGLGLAGAGAIHAVRSHQKKAKNRALLARIRPHGGMQGTELATFHDADGHVCSMSVTRPDGKRVTFGMTLPQRIIAFARERNGDGEFAPEAAEAGPDPVAMKKAYPLNAERGMRNAEMNTLSGGKKAAVGGTSSPAAALARALQASGFRMPQPAQDAQPALA